MGSAGGHRSRSKGRVVTTAVIPQIALTDDELQVLAARVNVEDLPTVLAVRPRHDDTSALHTAVDRATRTLTARGLISEGSVNAELAQELRALQRPDRELAMRLVTPDGIARVSVVRQGRIGVQVRRVGDEFVLGTMEYGAELAAAARAVLDALPRADAATIDPVGAPLAALTECLDDSADAPILADRLCALGAEPRSAMQLGSALASRVAFAEIVYYALTADEDRISRRPAAVAVFYTKRGRIVAAPSASPAGELWCTLKPASDHTIAQAIRQLVGLTEESWEDP